uniref:10 kDa heat shock protein, mitochondrial n=1 Tax=Pygocentrus nattereri TaxID=42514 RepID=A0A3B4CS36_PYGNA
MHNRWLYSPAAPPKLVLTKAFRKFLSTACWTKGGMMLPEKTQSQVLQGTAVAVGPGAISKILLPEYGGSKVILVEKDYYLFRDADILGKYVD